MNADDILKKHNLSPPTVGNDPVDQIAAKHGLKPPKPERGWLRAGADVGLSAVEGAVTGGRMVAEAAGANNIASRGLARMAEGLRGMRSAASQAEDYDAARRAQEAAGKGAGAETVASWESFKERPAHYLAQAVGTSIPTLAAMALTRGRVNPLAVGGGMGAVMGAGETKGGIYESVYQEALNAGKTEDDARAIAEKAQSYTGKNLDNILAGTGIGALAGATGVERAFGGSLARKAAPGIAKNVLRKGATEAGTEYIQEGHQALAGNIAAQREGFNVPTMEGVFGQAAHGALAGFAAGGMFGAGERLVAQPPATRDPTVDVIGDEVAGTQQQDAAPAMPPTGGFTPEEVAAFRNEQAENQKRMERDLAIQRGMADYEAQQRDSDALLEREKQAKQQEMLAQIHQRIAEVEAAKQLEAQRKAEEQAETFVDPRIAARVAASKDAGTDVIDSILPPSPEVEHAEEINIGPLGKAANVAKGTGSFKQIGEFADLVTQERADIEQRRNQQKGAADALQGQRQETTEAVTTPATPLQETEPVTQQADVPSAQTATSPEKAEASLQSEPDTFTKPADSKQEIDLREQIASLVKGKREADQFGTRNALDSAQQKAMSAMSGAKVMPAYFRSKAADMRKRNDTTNADTLDAIADAIAAHNKAVKAAATPESEKQAKAEAFKKRMAESRAKKQGAKDETSAVLPESNQGRSDQQGRSEGVVERPAGKPGGKRSAAKPAVRAPKAGAVVDAKEQDGEGLIFGRTFDDIKIAQQGGRLDRVIDVTKPPTPDMTTERFSEDKALLEAHGVDGLEKKGFHGVLDRLRRSGVIDGEGARETKSAAKPEQVATRKTEGKEAAPDAVKQSASEPTPAQKVDDAKLSRQPSQPQTYRVLSPDGKFIGTRELDGKQARELKDRGYTLTPWRLSRGGKGGITTDTAKSIAEAFVKAHKGSADIKVVANIEAIKDSDLYKQIAARGALNDVEGASYKGDIYLFPQNLESDIRAAEVLMHEGRHFAFAAIKGEGLNNVMAGIYKSNPLVRNAADAKKKTLGLKDIAEATEEALADMDVKQLRDLKGWPILVAHIKAKVREMAKALDKAGFINAASWLNERVNTWTDADVAKLLKDADTLVTKPRAVDTAGDDDAKLQRVWHGTPHIWAPEPGFPHGRPRLDKIGTGEGKQAYGWGFYTAQSEGVGKSYADTLGTRERVYLDGKEVISRDSRRERLDVSDPRIGAIYYGALLGKKKAAKQFMQDANAGRKWAEKALAELDQLGELRYEKSGALYQLDIPDATLPYLLDWDKPLSEQTKEVRKALEFDVERRGLSQKDDGKFIYKQMGRDDKSRSEYLASLGIVGNRYLDGQSRNRPLKDIKREFLAELPEDADFAEVSGLIGTGLFSPKNEALIKALRDNDWLGFDYPSQAISAALSKDLSGYDASPALLRAVETAKEGGTYNYVIWDQPTLDKIALLERNGEKLDAIREADARLSRKTEGVRLSTAKTIRPAWLGENGEVNDSVRIDPTLKAIAKGGLGMFESATDRLRRSGAPILIDLADKIDRYYDQAEARIGKINGKLRPVLKEIRKNEKANMADFEEYWRAHDNGREAEAKAILDRNPLVKQLVDVVKDVFDETGTENQNVDTPFGKGMKVYDSRLVKKDGDIIGRIVERNGEKLVYQNGELVGTLTGTSIKLAEGFATGKGDGTKLDGVTVGGYRLIGKFKRGEFWPRAFRADVQAVLQNPSTNLALWNEIVDALIDGGYIQKRDEAIAFVNDHFSNESSNDFFAGIEMARGLKLPDAFYDYSYDAFLRYAHKWSTRISQVEQFGQVTQPGQKDAFDNAIGNTLDYRTKNYIEAAADIVYTRRKNTLWTNILAHLNLLATALQLGNWATATVNLIGGTTLNVQHFGLKNTITAFREMAKDWEAISQRGTELGILNKDYLKILQDNEIHGQYDIHAVLNQKLSRFAAFTLKWGGYNGTEHIIRTTAMLAARTNLVGALRAWNKEPNGHDAKKYREHMERNRIDVDKLIKENGEGAETARYLRMMVNIPQGSYRIDQVPIYLDTVEGRFLFKYQKFATQVTRMFWQQILQPFVDTIKEGKSGRERAEAFVPVVRFFVAAIVGGYAILMVRSSLFGMNDPGDDLDDIAKAFENDDTAKAWAMLAGRAHANMIAAAGYGMFGNYIQMTMDVADQQRVKNPLTPPGVAPINAFVELISRGFEQGGRVTMTDIDQIAERTFALYRTARRGAATATNTMGIEGIGFAEMEQARRDTLYIRKVARNFAEDYGIEAKRTMTGRIGRTERSPENLEIYEAIMLGDAERARLLIKDALDAADDKKMRLQSIRSAIQSRHPVQLGASPASRMQVVQFRKWARDNLPESKVQRIEELITRYDRTAKMSGL